MMRISHLVIGASGAAAYAGLSDPYHLGLTVAAALVGSLAPDWDLSLGIKHRWITHWLIWPCLLWYFFPLTAGFCLGWILHLLADCLTVEGLSPFWPFTWRIRGLVRTGSQGEYVFLAIFVILIGVYVL